MQHFSIIPCHIIIKFITFVFNRHHMAIVNIMLGGQMDRHTVRRQVIIITKQRCTGAGCRFRRPQSPMLTSSRW